VPSLARRLWRRASSSRPAAWLADPRRAAPDTLDEEFLRRLERLTMLARQPAAGGIGGEHRSAARAPSTDFADYRPYMPGDDFRRIDWNAYGRLGHLYVKLTEAREQLLVHVLLDASGSMDWGEPSKLGYGRQLAAAIAYLALARFDRAGVTALGGQARRFPLVRGRARFHELLAFLNATPAAGRMTMDDALAEYRTDRRRGQVVLISDMLAPEGYQDGLDRLLQAGLDVVVLHLLSPQELEPEPGGDVELIDAESGELIEISLTEDTLTRYRERLDRWCADVEAFCTRRGIRYRRTSTATPFEDLLLDSLRRGLILR
jgi:uncharacterized protein (DUF58 family)